MRGLIMLARSTGHGISGPNERSQIIELND